MLSFNPTSPPTIRSIMRRSCDKVGVTYDGNGFPGLWLCRINAYRALTNSYADSSSASAPTPTRRRRQVPRLYLTIFHATSQHRGIS